MIFCILESNSISIPSHTKFREVEKINQHSINNFIHSLENSNLMTKIDTTLHADPNKNYEILASEIFNSKNKHIPRNIKKFNKRKHKKEKWMTEDLLTLVNRKNDLYKEWKSTNDIVEYNRKKINFKTFDKIIYKNIEEAKKIYYHTTFSAYKNNLKKTWAMINDTLHKKKNCNKFPTEFRINNESITDPIQISNHFNNYFANAGLNLASNMNVHHSIQNFTDYLNKPSNIDFTFESTSENDIYNIINNLKNKNSTGKDEISNKLLKSIKHIISKPLSVIINQSLVTGIFPNALKISKVIPLYKKGDKQYLSNYRPISLLPTISKVFERVLYTQIYDHFNINSLLCEEQYGFRSKHSTELATIKLVDKIIKDMDDIKNIITTVAVFLVSIQSI